MLFLWVCIPVVDKYNSQTYITLRSIHWSSSWTQALLLRDSTLSASSWRLSRDIVFGDQHVVEFYLRPSDLGVRDPNWEIFVQRILCPVKDTSFQSPETTWKSFLSLIRTRCSISVPTVPKRSSTKRLTIPVGFSCCWTSCNGIQHFLICSIYFCLHTRIHWNVT